MNKKLTGWISVNTAVLLFGIAGLFGKWVSLPAEMLVMGRTFFATLALGIVFFLKKKDQEKRNSPFLKLLLLPGLILIVHWYTFFKSIQMSTVAIGLFGYSTFPVFVYLLEIIFSNHAFSFKKFVYIMLAFSGVLIMFPDALNHMNHFYGLIFAIVSGFTFAVLAIINKHLLKYRSALEISLYQDMIAALVLLIFLYPKIPEINGNQIIQLAMLGIFCTAIAHTLYIHGMRYIRASTASVLALMEPVYGVLLAILLFHENPAWVYWIGGVFILIGGYGMFREEEK